MDWVFFQIKAQDYSNSLSPAHQPFSPPPPSSVQSDNNSTLNKISPSILLIIIILAIIFFISGLLHLLVRFLFRPSNRDTDDSDNVTALQGQLQQLFHLHDSGVDQSYIDTLPVFLYKAIIGLKNPFDCAVCLCEFEADDKLRLLPKCSHAFHLECIDTWLLSHSTCPLCRGSLLPEFPYNSSCSPVVLVLESGSESSREIVSNRDLAIASSVAGCLAEDDFGSSCTDYSQKLNEITNRDDGSVGVGSVRIIAGVEEKVVTVKLGKFRNVDADQGEGTSNTNTNNNSNVDARRCFSMGSFEYVMDESSSLQVPIRPQVRKQNSKNKKPAGMSIPLTPGHRAAMSECDYHSSREGFKGFDTLQSIEIHSADNNVSVNSISRNKMDSFSFSKIWLRSKKEKPVSVEDTSRRAFSFRFPLPNAETVDDMNTKDSMFIFQKPDAANDLKTKDYNSNNTSRRTISEIDVSRWESSSSERSAEEGIGNCNSSLESQPSMPSFARRTLLWLAGKQNKVVHSSSSDV